MNRFNTAAFTLCVLLACAGCTDDSGDEPGGHALETQQQALEKARDVEQDMRDAAQRQAEQIEESEKGDG